MNQPNNNIKDLKKQREKVLKMPDSPLKEELLKDLDAKEKTVVEK